jgi:lantibiotic modifying enzyme
MGDALLARAERFPDRGASWSSGPKQSTMNLTGFSHGTAGGAYALLGLFAATGKQEFRRIAEAALQFERSWFDDDESNWPDLRQVAQDVNPQTSRLPCATTWCHGAPGIAISRMRAAELLPDPAYRVEASIALATTAKHLRGWLNTPHVNYSVCHGVAGNAEVLLMGLRSGIHAVVDLSALIERTAKYGSVAHGSGGDSWPCGVGLGGESPNLMLGLAGIGYFYLRMARENIPSVIAPLSAPGWRSGL